MKTEKMTKNEGELEAGAPDLELDGRKYLGRITSVHGAVALIQDLRNRKPKGLGDQVDGAFEQLDALEGVLDEVLEQQANAREAVVASARFEMLGAVSKVTGPLAAFTASASDELATEATAVTRATFGTAPRELTKMRPRQAWVDIRRVLRKVEGQPALRKRLEALVPRAALVQLVMAHAALGDALRMTAPDDERALDARKVIARANARIDHYALCVLATADPGDAAARAVAEAALRPIVALRAENARVRRRAGGVEPDGEVEDDAEGVPTDPSATLAVTPAPRVPGIAPATPAVATPVEVEDG